MDIWLCCLYQRKQGELYAMHPVPEFMLSLSHGHFNLFLLPSLNTCLFAFVPLMTCFLLLISFHICLHLLCITYPALVFPPPCPVFLLSNYLQNSPQIENMFM